MDVHFYTLVEYTSVALNLIFLVLLMRESKWCWPFGILGSALAVLLFQSEGVKLYSEMILYSYYVAIGIYGWIRWQSENQSNFHIRKWSVRNHLIALLVGIICWPALGWFMSEMWHTNNPHLDAFTTVFSLIASYMQAEKVLTSWHVWIVVNGLSIWLYFNRSLDVYSILAIVYFIMSFAGLLQWTKRWSTQSQL